MESLSFNFNDDAFKKSFLNDDALKALIPNDFFKKPIIIHSSRPPQSRSRVYERSFSQDKQSFSFKVEKLHLPVFSGWGCFVCMPDAPFDIMHLN